MRRFAIVAIPAFYVLMGVDIGRAQRGTGDWMTSANDAQRSSWVRSDGKISRESLQKPGFELVWKLKFNNTARQLNSITPPALLDFFIGHRGFRSLGFFGGSSDRVIAVDIDLARIEWEKNFATGTAPAGTAPVPGGLTAAVTRPTTTAYPGAGFARGAGRATGAKSGVGLPHEGAVTLRTVPAAPPPVRRPAVPATPAAAAPNPFAPRVQWVFALTGDGKLHSLYVSNGDEPNPPVQFLPPNAHAQGLISFDNTVYVATTNGCGGVDDGVWALDRETQKVSQWKSSGKIAGTAGPAAGPEGVLYVTAGSELSALAPRTLQSLGSYKTGGADFTSSPVVFEFKGKNLIAATSNDGRLHLVDAAALSSAVAKSEPFSTANYAAGALASWQDESGTRWILAPSDKSIVAWKVVEKGGMPSLEQGWVSRSLVSPLPPVVINGVVFALSSGEFRGDAQLSAAQRAQRSTNAVLYALDGATGKEVWNSGKVVTSFVHSGGLSAGGGRVYVATYDSTQYAFGFPMEH